MNPEIKQKWLTALRSGEYKQGRHVLFDGKRFCCLGVLCDIYLRENNLVNDPAANWKLDNNENRYIMPYNGGPKAVLPPYVMYWAGLFSSNPSVPYKNKRDATTLSKINDYTPEDFSEIANLIEKYL